MNAIAQAAHAALNTPEHRAYEAAQYRKEERAERVDAIAFFGLLLCPVWIAIGQGACNLIGSFF